MYLEKLGIDPFTEPKQKTAALDKDKKVASSLTGPVLKPEGTTHASHTEQLHEHRVADHGCLLPAIAPVWVAAT